MSSPTTYDVLDAWDLLDPDLSVGQYNLRDWKKIAEALDGSHAGRPTPTLGSAQLGLHQGLRIAEGGDLVTKLAIPLVTTSAVWLPDPIYSLLTPTGAKAWNMLPESGSPFFTKPGIRVGWEGFWSVPTDRRRAVLNQRLPKVLSRLRELRPAVEAGAVRLFPWEPVILRDLEWIRRGVATLSTSEEIKALSERHTQEKYSRWGSPSRPARLLDRG